MFAHAVKTAVRGRRRAVREKDSTSVAHLDLGLLDRFVRHAARDLRPTPTPQHRLSAADSESPSRRKPAPPNDAGAVPSDGCVCWSSSARCSADPEAAVAASGLCLLLSSSAASWPAAARGGEEAGRTTENAGSSAPTCGAGHTTSIPHPIIGTNRTITSIWHLLKVGAN